jgi:hypothetical protein
MKVFAISKSLAVVAVLFSALFSSLVTCTADCYDFSVTTMNDTYFEFLPQLLFYGSVDWMSLQKGKNCGFYTYGDVFIKTYNKNTTGIYFVFKKTLGTTCTLDSTLRTFNNETWLYANSLNADPNVCGYYVGIANSASEDVMINIVRSAAEMLRKGWVWAAVLAGTVLTSTLL